jgi:hypothetical protein
MEKRVNAMKKLGFSDSEIKDVLEADARIDKGEKLFELTDEQKKAEKEARGTKTKAPTVYKLQKRERKADNDKREIIQCIDDALCCLVDDVEVINPEREISFLYNDKRYKIVLSAPREKKG